MRAGLPPARILNHDPVPGGIPDSINAQRALVWYEVYDRMIDALQREKSLKRYLRDWKLNLIERENPEWNDLYETLGPMWS